MVILEQQHGKYSEVYRAEQLRRSTFTQGLYGKHFRRLNTTRTEEYMRRAIHNILPEPYLEKVTTSVSTMMFIYIYMYCVPWGRNKPYMRRKSTWEYNSHTFTRIPFQV